MATSRDDIRNDALSPGFVLRQTPTEVFPRIARGVRDQETVENRARRDVRSPQAIGEPIGRNQRHVVIEQVEQIVPGRSFLVIQEDGRGCRGLTQHQGPKRSSEQDQTAVQHDNPRGCKRRRRFAECRIAFVGNCKLTANACAHAR